MAEHEPPEFWEASAGEDGETIMFQPKVLQPTMIGLG